MSLDALNSIDEGGRPPVVSIACSATYVVGFTRLEAEKEYEKQEVSIVFTGGRPGKVDISIRSTELTWPQSIRNLIEREVLSIGRRTVKEYRGERGYLFCATFSKR